jgi:hypothetical protein
MELSTSEGSLTKRHFRNMNRHEDNDGMTPRTAQAIDEHGTGVMAGSSCEKVGFYLH